MKELREAIEQQGIGMDGGIVRVDMFLNHRLDTGLITKMGQEFHKAFQHKKVDVILTAESSGIAMALTTAQAFGNLPVIVAKKGEPKNMTDDVYKARVYSYTRGMETTIRVYKGYLPKGVHVLIVDDFLANGEAVQGLVDLAEQAEANVVGVGVCIEKAFQTGGATLRSAGLDVVALASVTGIRDGKPVLD